MSSSPRGADSPRAPELTHPCVRCGRPVALDVSLCEFCNPLGLSQPSATQVHGTVFVALIVAVVVLAVAGRAALSGIGPFRGEVVDIQPAASGLAVTLDVANEGTKAGSTTCRVTLEARRGVGAAEVVQSPSVDGGRAARFTFSTTKFGVEPVPLAVACQGP